MQIIKTGLEILYFRYFKNCLGHFWKINPKILSKIYNEFQIFENVLFDAYIINLISPINYSL